MLSIIKFILNPNIVDIRRMLINFRFMFALMKIRVAVVLSLCLLIAHGYCPEAFAHGPNAKIPKQATRTISIIMDDNFFRPKVLNVRANETVRFIVKNAGEAVHEFNIGTVQQHLSHRDEMQQLVDHGILEIDKINHHLMNSKHGMSHDHRNSVLVEPGKSGSLIWTFEKTDNLKFACNVPGHYENGMHGTINFRR